MIKKWEFYNSDEKLVDEICEKYVDSVVEVIEKEGLTE